MTLHIDLDPTLEASLTNAAQLEGLSVEDFVRGCLKKQLGDRARVEAKGDSMKTATTKDALPNDSQPAKYSKAYELGKHLFGSFDSGRTDTSSRDEEILGEMFDEKHRRGH